MQCSDWACACLCSCYEDGVAGPEWIGFRLSDVQMDLVVF